MSTEDPTTPAPAPTKAKLVYFIQCGTTGPIKIGYTSNFANRFMVLQIANYEELRVVAAVPGGVRDEKALHARFKDDKIRGEWYQPSPAMLDYIATLPTGLLNNILVMWGDCIECGAPAYDRREVSEGKFVAYCRACTMKLDGRLDKLKVVWKTRTTRKTYRPCMVCSDVITVTRKGRCHKCDMYFRKNGFDRKIDPKTGRPAKKNLPGDCSNCGKYSERTVKGRCLLCYNYFNTTKRERPPHVLEAERKGLSTVSSKITQEQATEIIALHHTGKKPSWLAKIYQINPRSVRDVLMGKTWKDTPKPPGYEYRPARVGRNVKSPVRFSVPLVAGLRQKTFF